MVSVSMSDKSAASSVPTSLQCLKFQTQLFKILRHGFLPNEGVAIGVRFYFCSVNEGFCKVNAVYGCQYLDKLCEEVF